MDGSRLIADTQRLFAAPLCALFLVLAPWTLRYTPPSMGTTLTVLGDAKPGCNAIDRSTVLHIENGGSVWLNEDLLGEGTSGDRAAAQQLFDIERGRAQKGVFLLTSGTTPVSRVVELASTLHAAIPGLQIGYVTRQQLDRPSKEEAVHKNGDGKVIQKLAPPVALGCLTWPDDTASNRQ